MCALLAASRQPWVWLCRQFSGTPCTAAYSRAPSCGHALHKGAFIPGMECVPPRVLLCPQNIELKTTEMAQSDLQKYHKVPRWRSPFPSRCR